LAAACRPPVAKHCCTSETMIPSSQVTGLALVMDTEMSGPAYCVKKTLHTSQHVVLCDVIYSFCCVMIMTEMVPMWGTTFWDSDLCLSVFCYVFILFSSIFVSEELQDSRIALSVCVCVCVVVVVSMIKLSLCVFFFTSPRILDLGTWWRWVVSFTPLSLNPEGRSPCYSLDRRLVGPHSLFVWTRWWREKFPAPTGTRTPRTCSP
jgi:hypothetical protein